VTSYGADPTGNTDSTPALSLAQAASNAAFGMGQVACVYFPTGTYLINGNPTGFTGPGCVLGDGPLKTIVKTGPNLTTSVFSWTDAWIGAQSNLGFPYNGNTANVAAIRAGPILSNLSIIGNRSYGQQTAIDYIGHEDFGLIENVDVFYMNGSAFRTGIPAPGGADAYTRESRLVNFRAFNSGRAGAPVIDFGTVFNGGDSTNSNELTNVDVYAPYGAGIHLAPRTRYIEGTQIRVEGIENNPTGVQADLIQIGDGNSNIPPVGIHFRGLNLIDPYAGFAALHLAGTTSDLAYDYNFEGTIGGGNPVGNGLQLDVGRQAVFRFPANNVSGSELILGANIGSILIEAAKNEVGWNIVNNSTTPTGAFFPPVTSVVNTATGGNSFAFGTGSTASSNNSVAIGQYNVADSDGSVILGGIGAASRARAGWIGSGASPYFQFGQLGIFATVSNASEVPLRSINGTGPCITSFNTTHGIRVSLVARDISNPANLFYWNLSGGLLTRDTATSSTRVLGQTPVFGGSGTGATASARFAADTTGACLYVAFQPPSGNTDVWHVGGLVETNEVQ
jgi:hypothetical protein